VRNGGESVRTGKKHQQNLRKGKKKKSAVAGRDHHERKKKLSVVDIWTCKKEVVEGNTSLKSNSS